MIAKVRHGGDREPPPEWERLVPLAAPSERTVLEFEALRCIHEHFAAIEDPRFATARPLALFAEHAALLLEDVRWPNLAELLANPQTSGARLARATTHAGAWLREFHAASGLEAVVRHTTTRDELVGDLRERCEALGRLEGREAFFRELAERAARIAAKEVPSTLPEGIAHSDFWPGNVLVGEGEQVCAIDTQTTWRGAVFHDLAYYLNALKASNHRAYRSGRSRVSERAAALEGEFLAGYFGNEPIPWASVRLFELQLLVHNWRRSACSVRAVSLVSRPARALRLALKRPFYRQLAQLLLREAEGLAWTSARAQTGRLPT